MKSRSVFGVVAGGVAVLLVAAAAVYFLFLRSDTPSRVDLGTAVKTVESAKKAEGGIEGKWAVDTTTGSFDFESATGTFAGFRVKEELAGIGATEAVGRTGEVTGSITLTKSGVSAAELTVDMTSITTDKQRRDSRVQEALETSRFPTATFVLSKPVGFSADAAGGATVKVAAAGELTIHGVSRPTTFALQARLVGDTVVVVGSADVKLSDFGVTAPSAPLVLSVSDQATVEFNLLFKKA